MTEPDIHQLTLAGIAHRCARETERFFQRQGHDPRYCFELFRRAVAENDQHAWELVYVQYHPLVTGWVRRHPAFPDSGEEASYFVNRAFEKMWAALTPTKFAHFPNLKSLLRYLQVCVHSVILDHVRAAEQATVEVQVEFSFQGNGANLPVVEEQALARVQRQEFWAKITGRLRDEKERRVVYGSFVLGLKPRELYAEFQSTFSDVNEIYRIKENVMARLRRDAELAELLGWDA